MQINHKQLKSLYESWDSEEILARINSKTLEPEAENIAKTVLATRGFISELPPKTEIQEQETINTTEHELAKKLWKSYLVRICQVLFILPAWPPINHAIHRSGLFIGALWMGLLAVGFSYLGYKIGYAITKSICANDKKTYLQKRNAVWFLISKILLVYIFLFIMVDTIIPAANK